MTDKMHRRAQKAEGAVLAAKHAIDSWESALNFADRRKIMGTMAMYVINDVRKALNRIEK